MEHSSLIIGITLIFGAYMAWNIGANDLANAMGTSVGSKALKLRTAMILAAIMNFLGAYLVGPNVSATIRGRIIDPAIFTDINIFIIGMMASLLAASIWLNIATHYGMPVSTTHSIVGAILGFGLVTYGPKAVNWAVTGQIVASWFISPVCGGLLAAGIFLIIIRSIFFAQKPLLAAKKWIPWIVAGTTCLLVLSLLYKGLSNLNLIRNADNPDGLLPPGSSYVIALISAVIGYIGATFWMKTIPLQDDTSTRTQKFKIVENIFAKLQIASGCYVAFAGGANDVANAIGPISAVVSAANSGFIDAKAPVDPWLLVFGGVFIGAGIIIYGWKVIVTIGEKITDIKPSRGFAAEFGAATTVLVCSQMGLPISTTHTLVGAVIGIGFARGMRILNLQVVRSIVESWLYTVPISAVLSIIIFYIAKAIFL